MNWRGQNDIVPAGIVAFVAVAAMAREFFVDTPGFATGMAVLAIGVFLWAVAALESRE